jgi:hypothetical protein
LNEDEGLFSNNSGGGVVRNDAVQNSGVLDKVESKSRFANLCVYMYICICICICMYTYVYVRNDAVKNSGVMNKVESKSRSISFINELLDAYVYLYVNIHIYI